MASSLTGDFSILAKHDITHKKREPSAKDATKLASTEE